MLSENRPKQIWKRRFQNFTTFVYKLYHIIATLNWVSQLPCPYAPKGLPGCPAGWFLSPIPSLAPRIAPIKMFEMPDGKHRYLRSENNMFWSYLFSNKKYFLNVEIGQYVYHCKYFQSYKKADYTILENINAYHTRLPIVRLC